MDFSRDTAIKNIKRKPVRSGLMAALVLVLAFTLFTGAFMILSLQRGLSGYESRLGADVVVMPGETRGHGSLDDILLQGITGNYYMDAKEYEKIRTTEGVEQASPQFFLTSAKASCCSVRVQIIGFDPETDFTVQPWINETCKKDIGDGDLVIGSNVTMPANGKLAFYGGTYNVAAQMAPTGTGVDNAVYTNMNTIKEMARDAVSLRNVKALQHIDIDTAASAVMIKVKEGYDPEAVAGQINIRTMKSEATPSGSMVSGISSGLHKVSRLIGSLVIAIWILALIIMIAVFTMLANERKKEFAVLRIMGASRKMLFSILGTETALISLIGAVLGLILAVICVIPLSGVLKNSLDMPFLAPGAPLMAALLAGTLAVSLLAGWLASSLSVRKIKNSETGLLLKEDA